MKLSYRVFEPTDLFKPLERSVSSAEMDWIRKKLDGLAYPALKEEPHYGPNIKKLKGTHQYLYRYRLGHFRLFYGIDESNKTVVITAIKPRKTAYR